MTVELQPLIVKANVIADSQIVKANVIADSQIVKANVSTEIRPVIDVPEYEGEYTVTPTEETQTLETNGKRMTDDVTVEPIPSSYVQPIGELNISENGNYDVRQYAFAQVSVSGGGGGDISGIIDGSVVALVDSTASKVRPEFASIAKKWNYRNLPSGYTQVEYIESRGTEYIDTGVIMDTNSVGKTAQITFMYNTRGISTVLCGARLDSTNLMAFLTTFYGTPSWAYTNKTGSGANLDQNRVYFVQTELSNGWQAMHIDGVAQTQGTNAGAVTSTLPFYIFARNNNGTADSFVKGRIYDCVIRNGNANASKLCDLVPCLNENTGKYGMYDLVSNTFLSNQGTGDFTGGRTVPNLVYGYTSIDLAVTEIGDYAFYDNDLTTITLRANQVVTLGDNALYGCPIAHIYVPSALVNAYKADSQWSAWANKISAIA